MRLRHVVSALTALLLPVAAAQGRQSTPPAAGAGPDVPHAATTYKEIWQALKGLDGQAMSGSPVSNVTLHRDVGAFHLADGRVTLFGPINGHPAAAVFQGQGRFRFAPPIAAERAQLTRFYEVDSLDESFDWAVFLFADGTAAELEQAATFADPGPGASDAGGRLRKAIDVLSEDEEQWFNSAVLAPFLNGEQNGMFYALVHTDRRGDLYFTFDPDRREEVSLSKKGRRGGTYVVCQFHQAPDYTIDDLGSEWDKEQFAINQYTIDATLANNLDFSARTNLNLLADFDAPRWIRLSLFSELTVDSARWQDGRPATYFRGKENPNLWLYVDPATMTDQQDVLHLVYHGDIIKRRENWTFMLTSAGWYPRGGRAQARFDLTFHTPAKYKFVSIGDKTVDSTANKVRTTRWTTEGPAFNASFNIGDFEEYEFTDPRIPPVTLQIAESQHNRMTNFLLQEDMDQAVGTDIVNSLSFFQNWFGPVNVNHFYVTEIPFSHGEAFPGMIHLSWTTFQWTSNKGYDEIFRAHEVAHQWWGIGVGTDSYHDAWLGEGLADFSGLWYMQTVLMDPTKYMKRLTDMRKDILEAQKDAGPIWLGRRMLSEGSAQDYNTIVYEKGAWVFHMLRNLFLNLDEMSDEVFKDMLRDFYQTYQGHQVSTEQFKELVERHAGLDLDWFFNEWVYGTDIPTYRFSWTAEEMPDGQFKARARIRQENVPDDFKMAVPFKIDFGENGFARLRYFVDGPVTEIEFPPLPMRPEKIIFNDLESVLARVKTERWRN